MATYTYSRRRRRRPYRRMGRPIDTPTPGTVHGPSSGGGGGGGSSAASILGGSQYPSGGGGGGGGGSATPAATLGGSQYEPGPNPPGVSTVSSRGRDPRVLAVGGQPVRAAIAPTVDDFTANLSRYLTSGFDVRDRFAADSQQEAMQKERSSPKLRRGRARERAAEIIGGLVAPGPEGAEFSQEAQALAPEAIKAARKTGVPASVLLALTGQESGYGTNTGPSTAGAMGETQFIPGTREAMIEQHGVDPWKNSKSALLAAGLYLKELGFNEDPQGALSSYSGGYAAEEYNNPILERAEAFSALDKLANTKGPVGGGASAAPRKQRGVYMGSRKALKQLLGPKITQTQDWTDKEDRGDPGGTMHDIGTENAFAADLDPDEAIVDRIAKKLGLNPREVNYGTTGLESGQTFKGYEAEFLPYTHGSGPHVHIGLEWTGGTPPAGTVAGGGVPATSTSGSTSVGPISAGSGAGTTGAVAPSAAQRPMPSIAPITSSLAARAPSPAFMSGLAPRDRGGAEELYSTLAASARSSEEEEDELTSLDRLFTPRRRR